jgi:hypothetical protein
MNLLDLVILILKRKRTLIYAFLLSFILMVSYTCFISPIKYETVSDIKIDGNILFSTNNNITSVTKISNQVKLDLSEIDDIAAVEYIQNNKNFYKETGLIDYQGVISNLNSTKFLYSTVNSYKFKEYLKNKKIIEEVSQINIVEETETLNIKVSDINSAKIKNTYTKVINEIPTYISNEISLKIEQANNILKTNIKNEQNTVNGLIEKYINLKKTNSFSDILKLNEGIEVLNSISNLSYSINMNDSIITKFDNLIENPISPNLTIVKTDFSGTNVLNVYIIYLIIELISALLLSLIVIFVSEYFIKTKKYITSQKKS